VRKETGVISWFCSDSGYCEVHEGTVSFCTA